MRTGSVLFCLAGMLVGPAALVAETPPASHRMQADHAPTPYAAEEIRSGCPDGSWRLMRLSTLGPQGWAVSLQKTRFLHDGGSSTEFEVTQQDEAGNVRGEPRRGTATWEQLQAHASFPQADTCIERVPVTLDCGRFDCWLYIVVTPDAQGMREKRLWFARELPGPPVHMEEWLDQELVFHMTLVEYGPRLAGGTPRSR